MTALLDQDSQEDSAPVEEERSVGENCQGDPHRKWDALLHRPTLNTAANWKVADAKAPALRDGFPRRDTNTFVSESLFRKRTITTRVLRFVNWCRF